MGIKIALLGAFFAITTILALLGIKKVKTMGDFVLGGRAVGPWLSAFSYGTTYFSAVVFVGYAGNFGWSFGIAALWIGVGNAIIGSLLPWIVLGTRTRKMTKHLESATMPDFFAKRYDCKPMRLVASLIIFIFLIPYTTSVFNGLSKIFSIAFGINFIYCVIGMAIFTALYIILGGYLASAANNFLQGIVMLVGIIAVIIAVLNHNGGLTESLQLLKTSSGSEYTSIFGPKPLDLLGVLILTSLGPWGLPQMVHKFYSIKDESSIKKGTIISTVFALIVAGGSYFMGGFVRLFETADSAGKPVGGVDSLIPNMMNSTLSDFLMGVVIVLLFAASMSTLSSLVMASASTMTLDFFKGYCWKKMTEKTQLILIKVLCACFTILAVSLALRKNLLISNLMSISWGALAGAFLAPFLYGLFWKGVTKTAVWVSFASGVGITVANLFLEFNSAPNVGAIAMLAGLVIVPVVSLITPKISKTHSDYCFSCYEKKI